MRFIKFLEAQDRKLSPYMYSYFPHKPEDEGLLYLDHFSGMFDSSNLRTDDGKRVTLTSLAGLPKVITGSCGVRFDGKNLIGGLDEIDGDLTIAAPNLTSLEGIPSYVGGDIRILSDNPFAVFIKKHRFFKPRTKGGQFNEFGRAWLTLNSIKGIHRQLKEMRGLFLIDLGNDISLMPLLLVNGLDMIAVNTKSKRLTKAVTIYNKYLPNNRGMSGIGECQDELVEAGLEEFAEL